MLPFGYYVASSRSPVGYRDCHLDFLDRRGFQLVSDRSIGNERSFYTGDDARINLGIPSRATEQLSYPANNN